MKWFHIVLFLVVVTFWQFFLWLFIAALALATIAVFLFVIFYLIGMVSDLKIFILQARQSGLSFSQITLILASQPLFRVKPKSAVKLSSSLPERKGKVVFAKKVTQIRNGKEVTIRPKRAKALRFYVDD